jgi:hypothetical protein
VTASSIRRAAGAAALVAALGAAAAAFAVPPEDLPEGPFPPVQLSALDDGVPVRSEPGFLYRTLRELERGETVTVDGRKGSWLHVRPAGWAQAALFGEPETAEGSEPVRLRVTAEGSRVRSGPGTEHAVTGSRRAGELVEGVEQRDGWWRLADGGWLHGSLLQATDEEAGPARPRRLEPLRRWTYMDLNGTIYEVGEIDPASPIVPGLRRALRETGMLEDDWTFLRLVIFVPAGSDGVLYAPARQVVSVTDQAGQRYGSVYVRGPVERIPMHLRPFFVPHRIEPGQRFEGLLLFRPTLDPSRIADVQMALAGGPRTLYETP